MRGAPEGFLTALWLRWLGGILAAAGVVVVLVVVARWSHRDAVQAIAARSQGILTLYTSTLDGHLSRFEVLPQILAQDPALGDVLARRDDPDAFTTANRHLERLAQMTGASDAYVMDSRGMTVAASNWALEATFIGHDFSFRPYFKEAMQGRYGRYFALGTTSGQRGYYFSAPITNGDTIVGVAVVKAALAEIERSWAVADERIIVTDPDGVIFISSEPAWRYRSLQPLDISTLDEIVSGRRYANMDLASLPVKAQNTTAEGLPTLTITATTAPEGGSHTGSHTFLWQSRSMQGAGWTVHILSDMTPVTEQVAKHTMLVLLVLGLSLASALLLRQRLRWYRARIRSEQRTARLLAAKEEAIRRANDDLEARVADRTAALTATNARLRDEMAERERAQEQLRRAQDDLVQAGKLAAIGQLAAGVTHELNQPLAAMRAYADNALILMERGRTDDVARNLDLIAELTDRVADISGRLKSFARRARGEVGPVPLAEVVASSIRLVAVGRRLTDVIIDDQVHGHPIQVLGERVRLEQVFVNVLRNAVDAMATAPRKQIALALADGESEDEVIVTVTDTGHGLPADFTDHLFEPFYTTKSDDHGLGLGLSISQGILADFGGGLSAIDAPGGGAVFSIRLRRAAAKEPVHA